MALTVTALRLEVGIGSDFLGIGKVLGNLQGVRFFLTYVGLTPSFQSCMTCDQFSKFFLNPVSSVPGQLLQKFN